METNYHVQGFLEEERVYERRTVKSSNLAHTFVGFKLDEIQLTATIRSKRDVENLINFLVESEPCFR